MTGLRTHVRPFLKSERQEHLNTNDGSVSENGLTAPGVDPHLVAVADVSHQVILRQMDRERRASSIDDYTSIRPPCAATILSTMYSPKAEMPAVANRCRAECPSSHRTDAPFDRPDRRSLVVHRDHHLPVVPVAVIAIDPSGAPW